MATSFQTTLYRALKRTAQEINERDPKAGKYALRKVRHCSPDSPLKTLLQVGRDLERMAKKYESGALEAAIREMVEARMPSTVINAAGRYLRKIREMDQKIDQMYPIERNKAMTRKQIMDTAELLDRERTEAHNRFMAVLKRAGTRVKGGDMTARRYHSTKLAEYIIRHRVTDTDDLPSGYVVKESVSETRVPSGLIRAAKTYMSRLDDLDEYGGNDLDLMRWMDQDRADAHDELLRQLKRAGVKYASRWETEEIARLIGRKGLRDLDRIPKGLLESTSEIIVNQDGEIVLKSKDGSQVLGRYAYGPGEQYKNADTARDAAKKREKQVQFFKHKGESEHTSVMIALPVPYGVVTEIVPDWTPEDIGEPHVTLAYLGDASGFQDIERLAATVEDWAKREQPISGEINGHARFCNTGSEEGTDAVVLLYDAPALPGLRQRLVQALSNAGDVHVADNHGFCPHITVKYIEKNEASFSEPIVAIPLKIDRVMLCIGDEKAEYRLGRHSEADEPQGASSGVRRLQRTKDLEDEDPTEGLIEESVYEAVRGIYSRMA